MDEIIDMLRNKTIMVRFSRGEIRDFLERLGVEGYMISKIVDEPLPVPVADPEPPLAPSEVNEAARAYMAAQPSPMSEPVAEIVGPVLPND